MLQALQWARTRASFEGDAGSGGLSGPSSSSRMLRALTTKAHINMGKNHNTKKSARWKQATGSCTVTARRSRKRVRIRSRSIPNRQRQASRISLVSETRYKSLKKLFPEMADKLFAKIRRGSEGTVQNTHKNFAEAKIKSIIYR